MSNPKIPPPIVGAVCAGFIALIAYFKLGPYFAAPFALWVAIFLACTGLLIAFLSVKAFGKAKTTIHPLVPMKTKSLVVSGMNRISRNPMYLGMLLILIGVAVYFGYVAGLFPAALFMFYITQFQIKPEEAALSQLFGEEYEIYKSRVRRWI